MLVRVGGHQRNAATDIITYVSIGLISLSITSLFVHLYCTKKSSSIRKKIVEETQIELLQTTKLKAEERIQALEAEKK